MRTASRIANVLCLLAFLGWTGQSHAAVVFSNFGPGNTFPDVGRILQGEAVGNIGNVDQAAAFTTGVTDVVVTDVKLGIYVSSPANSPFDGRGPLDIIIAQDSAGKPGSALETVPLNLNTYLGQVVVAPVSLHLDANTQYWVIADAKGTFDGAWEFNPIGDLGPVAGRSNNGPWSLQNANDPRLVFSVEGRLVPEPGTLVLMATGALALLVCSRFRRR